MIQATFTPAAAFLLAIVLLAACAPSVQPADAPQSAPDSIARLVELHERYRVPQITTREFTQADLWGALGPVVEAAPRLTREVVGQSAEGRPIYAVQFGRGPTRVLLWSQMHGNESTATMALADLFRFLAEAPHDPLAQRLAQQLTITAIPMLNPDGAERFQRRNAVGIDINRDARAQATPEARTLKAVHDRFRPAFGFNLHDQDVRARVGTSDRLAAIALLAPPFDQARRDNAVRTRAKQVATVVGRAVEPLVPDHITRYNDTFNPRAFGDLMQSWGTSTVLIEAGGWKDDPEKQYLRRVNFVALLAALDAIATGSYASADPAWYQGLPENGRQVHDLLVRGGTVVLPGVAPVRADVAIEYVNPLAKRGGRIVEIGDLADSAARDTLDASGLFLHAPAGAHLSMDGPASFELRRGSTPTSEPVWIVQNGVARPAPTGVRR